MTACQPRSVRTATSNVQRPRWALSGWRRTSRGVPQPHSSLDRWWSSSRNSGCSSTAAKRETAACGAPGAELADEVREMSRQAPVSPPPGDPFQGLVEGDVGQLPAECLPLERLAGGELVLLEIPRPHRLPLLRGPLARGEAHEIERARAEGRRFPVDHGDFVSRAASAAAQQDVLAKQLPVDDADRYCTQAIDAGRVRVEPATDEVALRGVEVGQDLLDPLGTPGVMRAIVAGQKARLRGRQVARRRVKPAGPARRRRPARHVEEIVQHGPPAVF